MWQVLEEFYETLGSVSVSAVTGEGMDALFAAAGRCRQEYMSDYKPDLDKRRQVRPGSARICHVSLYSCRPKCVVLATSDPLSPSAWSWMRLRLAPSDLTSASCHLPGQLDMPPKQCACVSRPGLGPWFVA